MYVCIDHVTSRLHKTGSKTLLTVQIQACSHGVRWIYSIMWECLYLCMQPLRLVAGYGPAWNGVSFFPDALDMSICTI